MSDVSVTPPWPLVRVRWVDSTSPRMGWIKISAWESVGSLECVSVGYLIAEDERCKTIAPHLAYPDDSEQCQGNGIIVIPTGAIVSVEPLTGAAPSGRESARPA
jgi:hypothetical protein